MAVSLNSFVDTSRLTFVTRWLFVINAIITVVWGFAGFFMIPDLPNSPNPRAFWFRKEHAVMAMERLERHNRAEPKRMTLAGFKYECLP